MGLEKIFHPKSWFAGELKETKAERISRSGLLLIETLTKILVDWEELKKTPEARDKNLKGLELRFGQLSRNLALLQVAGITAESDSAKKDVLRQAVNLGLDTRNIMFEVDKIFGLEKETKQKLNEDMGQLQQTGEEIRDILSKR